MHARIRSAAADRRVPRLLHDDADGCECRKPKPGLLLQRAALRSGRQRAWSAIAGATSRPAGRRVAGRQFLSITATMKRILARTGRPCRVALRGRRLDSAPESRCGDTHSDGRRAHDMKLTDLRTKIFADGAELDGMLAHVPPAVHQGLHHQSDADAQGRHHRLPGVRQAGAGGDSRSADLVRGVLRRVRRDGAPGARDRHLGRERLREDSGHEHAARARLRSGPPAVARRRQGERHGDHDARAGARRWSMRSRAARRRTSRCSPGASPTPAAIRCR